MASFPHCERAASICAAVTFNAAGSVTVTYSFDTTAETLVRTKDGLDFPVADDVVSVAFSLAGNILTLDLEIKASGGGTDTTTTQIFLRKGTP